MIIDLFVIIVALTLLIMTGIAILNVLVFPRLNENNPNEQTNDELPLVSILIPARNEEVVISQTIQALLGQTYPNFEIIVLDDQSEDKTQGIVRSLSETDERLRLIQGEALPADWMGKSWACHQLAMNAQGGILVFTDADVRWHPNALQAIISDMAKADSDLYTVWPTQITKTWAERIVVPLMSMVITGYLPVVLTHYTPFAVFGAANGQCMVWRREAYEALGGHQIVANNVLDDVTMARAVKQGGYRLRMADGQGLIQCRMYHDWSSVRDGFAKNILAGYGNSVLALLIAWVFHWMIFLSPFVLLFSTTYRAWGLGFIVLGLGIRALSATFTRQRLQDAITLPIGVLLMSRIAAQAIMWHYGSGVRWKGRTLTTIKKRGA